MASTRPRRAAYAGSGAAVAGSRSGPTDAGAHTFNATLKTASTQSLMFMDGGMSHVETFDPKPELAKRHG